MNNIPPHTTCVSETRPQHFEDSVKVNKKPNYFWRKTCETITEILYMNEKEIKIYIY
jgi:hypothetical protein